ncbi:MAG: DUF805 domain-containing protein [Deltaproteobacteria bacterium]|jgi:uncharacterized membrane protein YhaH (DUF805 family)|nr:DUF805 domain-containing protein [Deltaproteobacteria bacterium]
MGAAAKTFFVNIVSLLVVDFSGRANRSQYWRCFIVNTVICFVIFTLTAVQIKHILFLFTRKFDIIKICLIFYGYFLYLPFISTTTRRIHDFNGQSFLTLLNLIPIINFISGVVFGCLPGNPKPNEFGYPTDVKYQFNQFNPYDNQETTDMGPGRPNSRPPAYPVGSPISPPGPGQGPCPGTDQGPSQGKFQVAKPYVGTPPRPIAQPPEKGNSPDLSTDQSAKITAPQAKAAGKTPPPVF